MGAVFSLLAASVVGVLLAACSGAFSAGRKYYLTGLASACVAYIIGLPVAVFFQRYHIHLPLAGAAALDPAVEETVRTVAVFAFLPRTLDRGCWFAFAVGYGLFETTLKLADNMVFLGAGSGSTRAAMLLMAPLVPLMLHIFLCVLAMRLRSSPRVGALFVFLATFALHWIHNASVLGLPRPEDWTFGLLEIGVRTAALAFLTFLVAR